MLATVLAVFVSRAAALQTFQSAKARHPHTEALAYRWPTPGKSGAGVLISDHVAMRLAGPATLLHMLDMCGQEAALKQRLDQVHKRGELKLHIIGSSNVMEPSMAWPGLLRGWPQSSKNQSLSELSGPHLSEHAKILAAEWGVSSAFENVRLNMIFNGYAASFIDWGVEAKCLDAFQAANQDAMRRNDSVDCVFGIYDQVVKERGLAVPDLAVMINAGITTELDIENWRSTLSYLLDHDVPTVVTNYVGSHRDPIWIGYEEARTIALESKVIGGSPAGLMGIGYRSSSPSMDCTVTTEKDVDEVSTSMDFTDLHQLESLGAHVIASGNNPFFWADSSDASGLGNGQFIFFQGRTNK